MLLQSAFWNEEAVDYIFLFLKEVYIIIYIMGVKFSVDARNYNSYEL